MKLTGLPPVVLACGDHRLDLSRPQVMGILNVTPDSFSDGGRYRQLDQALAQAEAMLEAGAAIIDVGGESTRPGASAVAASEEQQRVVPVVQALRQRFNAVISVDTSSPVVFEQAAAEGAVIWNDVRALQRPGALQLAARLQLPVILMHNRGSAVHDFTDSANRYAHYQQLLPEIMTELRQRIDAALEAGLARQQLVIDPGFGFAKTYAQQLQLLDELWRLQALQLPVLTGLSRKRFLGAVLANATGEPAPVDERLIAGVGAALLCVQQGVSLIRTHDVPETVQALALWQQVQSAGQPADATDSVMI